MTYNVTLRLDLDMAKVNQHAKYHSFQKFCSQTHTPHTQLAECITWITKLVDKYELTMANVWLQSLQVETRDWT